MEKLEIGIPVIEDEETFEEQGDGYLHCPLCNFVMKQTEGLVSCTNLQCPNYKGMAG